MLFMKSLHNLEVRYSGKFVFRKQHGQTFLQNNKFQTLYKINADTLLDELKIKKKNGMGISCQPMLQPTQVIIL